MTIVEFQQWIDNALTRGQIITAVIVIALVLYLHFFVKEIRIQK